MEKIWLKQYPAGVPAEIDVNQYPSLVALLDESFRRYGDRTAYKFMGKSITFKEVDQASAAFAAWLQGQGLAKGDRVAVMLPNVPQYPVAIAAILRAGLPRGRPGASVEHPSLRACPRPQNPRSTEPGSE